MIILRWGFKKWDFVRVFILKNFWKDNLFFKNKSRFKSFKETPYLGKDVGLCVQSSNVFLYVDLVSFKSDSSWVRTIIGQNPRKVSLKLYRLIALCSIVIFIFSESGTQDDSKFFLQKKIISKDECFLCRDDTKLTIFYVYQPCGHGFYACDECSDKSIRCVMNCHSIDKIKCYPQSWD